MVMFSASPWVTIDTGKCAVISAPAIYKVIGGPGTLEITTLATTGMRLLATALLYSGVIRLISQGMPSVGKSSVTVVIAPFMPPVSFLAALLASRIAAMRLAGSAMLVAMFTSIIVTWLLALVSPGARRLTGTAAIIALVKVALSPAK